jgi:hypothetical protein
MNALLTRGLKLASTAVVAAFLSLGAMTGFAKPAEASSVSFSIGIGDGYHYYNPHRRSYYHFYYIDDYCRNFRSHHWRGPARSHYCWRGAWNSRRDYRWHSRYDAWDRHRDRYHDRHDRWDRRDWDRHWGARYRDRDHDGRNDRFENDRGRVSDSTRPRYDRDRDGRVDRYEDDRGYNSDTRRGR